LELRRPFLRKGRNLFGGKLNNRVGWLGLIWGRRLVGHLKEFTYLRTFLKKDLITKKRRIWKKGGFQKGGVIYRTHNKEVFIGNYQFLLLLGPIIREGLLIWTSLFNYF